MQSLALLDVSPGFSVVYISLATTRYDKPHVTPRRYRAAHTRLLIALTNPGSVCFTVFDVQGLNLGHNYDKIKSTKCQMCLSHFSRMMTLEHGRHARCEIE